MIRGKIKRSISVLLAAAMLVTSCPINVFAEEAVLQTQSAAEGKNDLALASPSNTKNETQEGEKSSESIKHTTENNADYVAEESTKKATDSDAEYITESATSSDAEYDETNYPAFNLTSEKIDGIKVTVTAEEGVFPKGAKLSVKKISKSNEDKKDIDAAVDNAKLLEEDNDDEDTTTESYTFDIKVLDKDGNELQPKNDANVNVKFELVDKTQQLTSAKVYHLEETDESKLAKLDELLEKAEETAKAAKSIEEAEDNFDYSQLDGEVIDNVTKKQNKINDAVAKLIKAHEEASNEETEEIEFKETAFIATELTAEIKNDEESNVIETTTAGFSYYVVECCLGTNSNALDPLTFTAEEKGARVAFYPYEKEKLEYRTNSGTDWTDWTEVEGISVYLKEIGDKVQFRGKDVVTDYESQFTIYGRVAASGSVASLTDSDSLGSDVKLTSYCYAYMFYDCTGLTTAPELPATALAEGCYSNMFYGCTGLTEAPSLPAKELETYCYQSMFSNCTGLETAPELSATKLAAGCYEYMFQGCTGLKTAPKLDATELEASCYSNMFEGCTSLETAPSLPAKELKAYCYLGMFWNCSSLKVEENTSGNLIFKCPASIPTNAVFYMFANTGGTYKGTPTANNSYYTEKVVETYTVTYDKNGGSGDVPVDKTEYTSGDSVTVLDKTDSLVKDGYRFIGWNTNSAATTAEYVAGDTFNISQNTTLYAKWDAKEAVYGGIIPREKGDAKAWANLETQIESKQSYIEEKNNLTMPTIIKALTDAGYTADETNAKYKVEAYLVADKSTTAAAQGGYRYSITPMYDLYATNGTDSVKMAQAQSIEIGEETEVTLDIPAEIKYESGSVIDVYHYGTGNTVKETFKNVTVSKDGKTVLFTTTGLSDFEVVIAGKYVAEVTIDGVTTKYETIEAAISAWQTSGGTLTLLANSYVSTQITPGVSGSTIDFNGYTINANISDGNRLIKVNTGIELNLKDSSTQGESVANGINASTIKNNSTLIEVEGILNLYNITIWQNKCTSSGGLFFIHGNNAVVNMYSGTVKDCNAATAGGAAIIRTGGTFNLEGGTITGNTAGSYAALYADDNTGKITISGGSIYANGDDTDTALSVGTRNEANLTVTGGTFGEKALMDKLGTDYIFIEEIDDDGKITYKVYEEPEVDLVAILNHTASKKSDIEYYISYSALAEKYPAGITKVGIFTDDTKAQIESGIGLSSSYRFIANTDAETKTAFPWTLEKLTYKNIIYMVDSVQYGEAEPHIVGDPIVLKAEPTKEGHAFSGWKNVPDPQVMPNKDITITGTFSKKSYTVKYMVGDEEYSTESKKYDSTVTLIAKPEITGYTVGEWTSTDVDIENGQFTMPAKTVVISATKTAWTDHTVTYKVGDKTVKQESYTQYDEVTLSYSQTGYDVVSMTSSDVTITDNKFIMPGKDVDINVTLQAKKYTLTWVNEGVESSSKVSYGSTIEIPEYTKTGHTLSWDKEIPATMPANDLTVTAVWTPITYKILYRDRGGDDFTGVAAVTTHTYGTDTNLGVGTKANATFEGWYTDSDCTKEITVLGATDYTADITIYANWKNNSDVAAIGNMYYATIGAAMEKAKTGDTIEILQDIPELPAAVAVNKNVTIDINGKTIKSTKITSGSLFTVSATATIKDGKIDSGITAITVTSGTLTADNLDVWSNTNGTNAVKVTSGKVIISDGKFGARGGNAISATASTSEITGGYFNGAVTAAKGYSCIENTDPTYIYKVVSDESLTFTITLDSEGAAEHGTTSVQAIYTKALTNITIPSKSDSGFTGYFTEADGKGTKIYNADGTPAVTASPFKKATTLYAAWSQYEAQINEGTKYASLKEAIEAAKTGDTVKLLKDADGKWDPGVAVLNKNITVDFGQYSYDGLFTVGIEYVTSGGKVVDYKYGDATVTINSSNDTVENDVCLEVYGNSNLTINGGQYSKISELGSTAQASFITVYPGSTLTINDGIYNNNIYNIGTTTINDGTIRGNIFADTDATTSWGKLAATPIVLTINGGTFTGDSEDADGKSIDVAECSIITINDGTINGSVTVEGYYRRKTKEEFEAVLNIEGGTFSGNITANDLATVNIKNIDYAAGGLIKADGDGIVNITGGTYYAGGGNLRLVGADSTFVVTGGKYKETSPSFVPDTHIIVSAVEEGTTWYYVYELPEAWIVGTSSVGSLTDMINTAASGKTIRLMKSFEDSEGNGYILKSGQILDINGKTLTTPALIAEAGKILDSVTDEANKGKIVVGISNLRTSASNGGYIPLYDTDGYQFYPFALGLKNINPCPDSKRPGRVYSYYYLKVKNGGPTSKTYNYGSKAYSLLATGNSGIDFVTDIKWKGAEKGYRYNNIVGRYGTKQVADAPSTMAIYTYFNVTDEERSGNKLDVTATFNSKCGFKISYSHSYTYK